VDAFVDEHGAATHFGVPVAPLVPIGRCLVFWLLAAPIVAIAVAGNFLPLVAGYFAGRRLADAPNVITLWRTIAGIPAAVFYWMVIVVLSLISGAPIFLILCIAITLAGLALYRKTLQVTAMLMNAIRRPGLTSLFRTLYDAIQKALADV